MTHIVEAIHWAAPSTWPTVVGVWQAESFKCAKALAGRYLYEKYLYGDYCVIIRRASDNEIVCTVKVVCQKVKWFYSEKEKEC